MRIFSISFLFENIVRSFTAFIHFSGKRMRLRKTIPAQAAAKTSRICDTGAGSMRTAVPVNAAASP